MGEAPGAPRHSDESLGPPPCQGPWDASLLWVVSVVLFPSSLPSTTVDQRFDLMNVCNCGPSGGLQETFPGLLQCLVLLSCSPYTGSLDVALAILGLLSSKFTTYPKVYFTSYGKED
ncbi:unnamed protein product [Arctogadus glacialis]